MFIKFVCVIISSLIFVNANNSSFEDSKVNKRSNYFDTAKVSSDTYSSFMVGYSVLYKTSSNKTNSKQSMYFVIDKGFILANDNILLGFYLDGAAGGFYSLSFNSSLGARILDGRLIPSISIGYGLINHMHNNTQYNIHGANAGVALFLDIANGFGLEIGYRHGLHPFRTTKNTDIKVRNIQSFMISFKFIDFSI